MQVQAAIIRTRRDLTFGLLLKTILMTTAMICLLLGAGGANSSVVLGGIGAVWIIWMMLNYRSVKASRIAATSPSLIASGQYERAEAAIDEAMHSFSLFRTVKLMTLHHLAVLRHAQRRWGEAAAVSAELLRHRRAGSVAGLTTRSRLILADALLELGDLRGAHTAILALYQDRLALNEALSLTLLQSDYLTRIGAWDELMRGIAHKVQLAELMPSANAARTQGYLALGAMHVGRADWQRWLTRRVELLVSPEELLAERPILAPLWTVADSPPSTVAPPPVIEA